MADNTRVKKLARRLQAETGLRYTEALARVRLQGVLRDSERNMNKTVDTLFLGTCTLAPRETKTLVIHSERFGFVRDVRIRAPSLENLAGDDDHVIGLLAVKDFIVAGFPLVMNGLSVPANLLIGTIRRVLVAPGQRIEMTVTSFLQMEQVVSVELDFEDQTAQQVEAAEEEFKRPRRVNENQYSGLGCAVIPAGGTEELQDTLSRTLRIGRSLWETSARGLVLEQISVAGLPVSTLTGQLVLVGQTVSLRFHNPTKDSIMVSGGFTADELDPYLMQQLYEQAPINAVKKTTPPVSQQQGRTEPWGAAHHGVFSQSLTPWAGMKLVSVEITVVGSAPPESFSLSVIGAQGSDPVGTGVKQYHWDWWEVEDVEGQWAATGWPEIDRVFGPGDTLGVVLRGPGVVAAQVFTSWNPAQE